MPLIFFKLNEKEKETLATYDYDRHMDETDVSALRPKSLQK